jgi:hypothetical protein
VPLQRRPESACRILPAIRALGCTFAIVGGKFSVICAFCCSRLQSAAGASRGHWGSCPDADWNALFNHYSDPNSDQNADANSEQQPDTEQDAVNDPDNVVNLHGNSLSNTLTSYYTLPGTRILGALCRVLFRDHTLTQMNHARPSLPRPPRQAGFFDAEFYSGSAGAESPCKNNLASLYSFGPAAGDVAAKSNDGATVLSNSGALFFYGDVYTVACVLANGAVILRFSGPCTSAAWSTLASPFGGLGAGVLLFWQDIDTASVLGTTGYASAAQNTHYSELNLCALLMHPFIHPPCIWLQCA